VWLHHNGGQLRRVSSRGEAHFLCDAGYRLPAEIAGPRLSVPVAGGAVVSWDRALDASQALLAPAIKSGTLGVVLSAQSSTFDLCAVSAFAIERALAVQTYVFEQPPGLAAPPLVAADKNANTAAVAALAPSAMSLDQLVADVNGGRVDAVLVVGPVDLSIEAGASLWQALRALSALIVATAYEDPLAVMATVALPLATFTESPSSFVNGQGHAQALAPIAPPLGDALAGWDIINHLARRLGVELGFDSLTDVRAWLLRRHPSLCPEVMA
jgi:NADH dehydrogenase/NADH:ubiquinone oxidoreductase subunit G